MEIVKTSEELEKQILEDARKKAARILENSDKECAEIRAQWARKLEEERLRMDGDFERKRAGMRAELESALPLDFMRTRLAFTEEAVRGELDAFFGSLSSTEVAGIISTLVKRVSRIFSGKHIIAFVGGMDAKAAEKLLRAEIPEVNVAGVKPITEAGIVGGKKVAGGEQGIVLETEDRKIRYRGTFRELQQMLMEEHREELVSALLGKSV